MLHTYHGILAVTLLLKISLQSGGHRLVPGVGSLDIESEARVLDRLGSSGAKASYTDIRLLEVGEVLKERRDTGGAEEYQHVIVKLLVRTEIIADSAVHDSLCIIDLGVVKYGRVVIVDIAYRIKVFLLIVLRKEGEQIGKLAGIGVKNLALAIYYVFLQVESDSLGRTEIFHRVGYGDTHFLTETEEMVDCRAGREYDSRKLGYRDFGLAEFLGRQSLYFYERTKVNLYAVFFGDFIVRGLVRCRFRLGY